MLTTSSPISRNVTAREGVATHLTAECMAGVWKLRSGYALPPLPARDILILIVAAFSS